MSKKRASRPVESEMLPEYDLAGKPAVRGKYYEKLRDGYKIRVIGKDGASKVQEVLRPRPAITLDRDVSEYFQDSESVNAALRGLIKLLPQKRRAKA